MNKRGQNMIEYVLLVVAVLGVMIPLLMKKGAYQTAVENALNKATAQTIEKAANDIQF